MASHATKHFNHQRFTATLQIPLVIWLVVSIIRHGGDSHQDFMAWVGSFWTAALLVAFVCSVFYHMRLGMEEVIADYIHKRSTRSTLELLNTAFALVLGVVAVGAIIAITFIA